MEDSQRKTEWYVLCYQLPLYNCAELLFLLIKPFAFFDVLVAVAVIGS